MRKKIKLLSVILCVLALTGCNKSSQNELTISVATSLLNPINEIIKEYENENNVKVNINFGGSGTLKSQIENGADVCAYFSANEKFMDELVEKNMVKEDEINVPISNSLVLIKSDKCKYDIKSLKDLLKYDITMAIGQIDTVPAGQYAKESLEKLNIFNEIKDNQKFYIVDDTIVIFFDLYDIAPYVAGIPEFPINKEIISNLLNNQYKEIIFFKE